MNFRLSAFAAVFLFLSASVSAQEWASYGTISAEPTEGRICKGDTNGKDIICASPAPYVDSSGRVAIGASDTWGADLLVWRASGYPIARLGSWGYMGLGGTAGYPYFGTTLYFDGTNWVSSHATVRGTILRMGANSINFSSAAANTNPAVLTDHFTIDATNGNVGIGTTSPGAKLDVVGTIKVSDAAATCSVAADRGKFRYNTATGKFQICK